GPPHARGAATPRRPRRRRECRNGADSTATSRSRSLNPPHHPARAPHLLAHRGRIHDGTTGTARRDVVGAGALHGGHREPQPGAAAGHRDRPVGVRAAAQGEPCRPRGDGGDVVDERRGDDPDHCGERGVRRGAAGDRDRVRDRASVRGAVGGGPVGDGLRHGLSVPRVRGREPDKKIERAFVGQSGGAPSGTDSGMVFLFLGFGVASLIKLAQGSSTVAMITSAAMLAAMLPASGLPFHTVYVATAIASGSLVGTWMNDSGFWLFSKMGGVSELETFKSWTPVLASVGITSMVTTVVLALLVPLR